MQKTSGFPKSATVLYGLAVALSTLLIVYRLITGSFPPTQASLGIVLAGIVCATIPSALLAHWYLTTGTTLGKRHRPWR